VAGAVQAAHDGADGHAEGAGGFLVTEPVDIDELDDLAEPGGETGHGVGDGGVEGLAHDDGFGAAVHVPLVLGPLTGVGVAQEGRAAATDAVGLGVAHDGQQPRPWMGSVEATDRPEGAQQRVLHQVFGVRRVTGARQRHPQQHVELGQDVARKGLVVGQGALAWGSSHGLETLPPPVAFHKRGRGNRSSVLPGPRGDAVRRAPPDMPGRRRLCRRRAAAWPGGGSGGASGRVLGVQW
jgi:hypothetical protein